LELKSSQVPHHLSSSANTVLISETKYNVKILKIILLLRRNQLIRFISKESEEIEVKKSKNEEEDGQNQTSPPEKDVNSQARKN
jgi:hypothetical protein